MPVIVGKTIDQLNQVTAITASDELVVYDAESGTGVEPTKKVTGSNLASSVKTLGSLLGTSDVVNDLTSTATDKPLSANMGKTLNDNMKPSISTSFTFEADVVGLGNQYYAMKQGKVVVLSCGFKITANKSNYTKLATLPSGFWPTKEIEFIGMSYYERGVYAMYITNQGELYCRNGINATNMLVFNVAYIQVD